MIEKIVNIIDKLYYHKIIFDYLKKIELKTCFDVGSHKGEFLSNLINIKEVKEIHCFEPQRSIFKNLRINSFNKKVKFNNIALSNVNIKKKLNINILSSTSTFSKINKNNIYYKLKNFFFFKKNSFEKSYFVKCEKLDSYVKKNKIKYIDLLKIDTEGHELNVLKGASISLKKKIKYILIEISSEKKYKNYQINLIENIIINNKFKLLKIFKHPFLSFEDRLYFNENF